jgi:hypothetical protein
MKFFLDENFPRPALMQLQSAGQPDLVAATEDGRAPGKNFFTRIAN